MAESRGDSLERGRFPGLLGFLRLSSRFAERRDLVGWRISRPASNRTTMKSVLPKIARNSFGVTVRCAPRWRWSFLPKTMRKCAAFRSPTWERRTRIVQVTSYAELVIAPQAADEAHPAFSNFFVETEFVAGAEALLATRRRQSEKEQPVWVAHVAVVEGESVGDLQVETDRARFVGRGHQVRDPLSVTDGRPLSNTVGPVLDPVMSMRHTVRISPGTTARIVFSTIVAESRDKVLDLVDKYRDAGTWERTLTSAWTQAQVQLHHLGITPGRSPLVPATRQCAAVLRRFHATVFRRAKPKPDSGCLRCGRTEFPVICPSSWSGSTRPRMLGLSANY